VKPLFSDDERIRAVKNFIVARYQGLADINSFNAIVPYLREHRIKILHPSIAKKYALSGAFSPISDAEEYFEWLVAVVTGAESVSEDIVKQANDQLFQFIHVMRDSIRMDRKVQLVAPYDWQALFTSFDERLTDMQRIIDRGDKDIAETLSKILQWMKKYNPLLDTLDKENKKLFGEGKN